MHSFQFHHPTSTSVGLNGAPSKNCTGKARQYLGLNSIRPNALTCCLYFGLSKNHHKKKFKGKVCKLSMKYGILQPIQNHLCLNLVRINDRGLYVYEHFKMMSE